MDRLLCGQELAVLSGRPASGVAQGGPGQRPYQAGRQSGSSGRSAFHESLWSVRLC